MNVEHIIEHKVTDFLDYFHKEKTTMTDTSQAAGTTDTTQASAQAGTELPWWSALHQNLIVFDNRIQAFLPKLQSIATNPMLDDGIEALLAAFAGPMADEVFIAVVNLLKAKPEDHLDSAIALLTVVAHKSPAPASLASSGQAFASSGQAFADAVAQAQPAVAAAVQQAQQPVTATGPQAVMQPRVI